ncbi:MAG: DUF488 family protein [Conexivisphaerales archaeon]
MIKAKRVYEPAKESDGFRFLIDRLWPRGIKKEQLKLDSWLKSISPSDELRRWFSHQPSKWEEFKRRYYNEIKDKPEYRRLVELAKQKDITLLYSSKETVYNNAIALKEFVESEIRKV